MRAISQAGLHPANCRLIDAEEARMTLAGDGTSAVLVLGFESTDHPVDEPMARALALCREHGGDADTPSRGRPSGEARSDDAVGSWRQAFLRAPYMRDVFVAMGVISDTFETAITWDRFPRFTQWVMAAAGRRRPRAASGAGSAHVSCRFTHVYPDGPAPYYTVLAPARRGEEVEQWAAIKQAVSDVVIELGGTITHHHAVGRDHRPWYDRQRPDVFAAALRGAKAAVDPGASSTPVCSWTPAVVRRRARAGRRRWPAGGGARPRRQRPRRGVRQGVPPPKVISTRA